MPHIPQQPASRLAPTSGMPPELGVHATPSQRNSTPVPATPAKPARATGPLRLARISPRTHEVPADRVFEHLFGRRLEPHPVTGVVNLTSKNGATDGQQRLVPAPTAGIPTAG